MTSDAYLASLFHRDYLIELGEYEPSYPTLAEAQKSAVLIKDMKFCQLEKRLLKHAELTAHFLHFQIIRFEPFEEFDKPNLKHVPFLFSKTANIKRYVNGEYIWSSLGEFYFMDILNSVSLHSISPINQFFKGENV